MTGYNIGVKLAGLTVLFTACIYAQPILVYSEFARVSANGNVSAPANPREILSPAVTRNGFTSFQVVVKGTEGAPWQLFVAQNPENAVGVTLYRENGDRLEPVTQPARGVNTQVFWMDLWADKNARVQRIKVEPQLNMNNDWTIYPMEVRIMAATVPDGTWPAGTAAPGEVMRGFLCGALSTPAPSTDAALPPGPTIPALRFRNAQQDRALAPKASRIDLQTHFGDCGAPPPADNPEWYFKIRDFLFRLP